MKKLSYEQGKEILEKRWGPDCPQNLEIINGFVKIFGMDQNSIVAELGNDPNLCQRVLRLANEGLKEIEQKRNSGLYGENGLYPENDERASEGIAVRYREKLEHELRDYHGGLLSGIYHPDRPEIGQPISDQDTGSGDETGSTDEGSTADVLYDS